MANYTTTSLEATKYLCGLIRDLASVSEGIDDINLRSDGTFSSVMIDTLIKKCLEDANEYTEKLVANLSRLELKLVTNESEITQPNILYLFKPDGATSYNQYVVIEGNKVLLGTCDIDMAQYLKIADASKTYATKTELKAVTDKIGTTTLTTTAQTLTGSIEEVKGIAEQGALLTVTKTQYDQLVAGQTVNIDGKDYTYDSNTYYVVKDDSDTIVTTSTIDSTSTDSEVPTAKAVNDSYHLKTYTSPEQLGITSYFIPDIIEAMPMGSKFEMGLLNNNPIFSHVENLIPVGNTSGLIANNGYLEIIRGDSTITEPNSKSYRFRVMYTTHTDGVYGDTYIAQVDMKNKVVKKWEKICTTTAEDVPVTKINIINGIVNPNCNYQVKNGVCYIQLNSGTYSLGENVNGLQLATGLPIPASGKVANTYVPWASADASKQVILFVDGVGDLRLHAGVGANGCPVFTSFSYPVKES